MELSAASRISGTRKDQSTTADQNARPGQGHGSWDSDAMDPEAVFGLRTGSGAVRKEESRQGMCQGQVAGELDT